MDNFIYPILHNKINLGNNIFHNLLDYGNEYIEKLSVDEDKARNSLLVIDSSIHEKFNSRKKFDVSEEGKELHSLKTIRGNDKTPITIISDDIINRNFKINELNKKTRNLVTMSLRLKNKYTLKQVLKEGRQIKNRV